MGRFGGAIRSRAAIGGTGALLLLTFGAVQTTQAGAVTANLVAVGDMNGCTSDGQPTGSRRTADLVAALPGPFALLGDAVQSPVTTLEQYQSCYDPSWGRFNDRVRPVPGNHDYRQSGASGYFSYFGSRAGSQPLGSYTYTAGDWQVFAVNSNCDEIGGCATRVGRLPVAGLGAGIVEPRRVSWPTGTTRAGRRATSTATTPRWPRCSRSCTRTRSSSC